MMEEEDDLSISYKLCGYILPIVSVFSSQTPIPFLTPCSLASGRDRLGFQTINGDLLLPIERDSGLSLSKKKRRARHGSDVFYQLSGLLSNGCLRIKCRVLKGFSGKIDDRVVLLVDIYLPVEVWHDGWQFPNLGALAGAFFKHVRCKEWCRLPLITPCRHFLCLDCVSVDSEKCTYPGCGYQYEMQSPEVLRRSENPNPKWPVPKDLIELQPSYEQNNWEPDWQSTSSSKVAYLVDKLRNLQDSNINCRYSEESSGCNRHILYSQKMNSMGNDSTSNGQSCMHDKVIVYSQFLEHINVIEQQFTIAGIKYAGMYSPMHSINKMKSLQLFRHDPACMVLLMDGSAALGLDLSFVTHVFLMEPIWDRK